MLVESFGKVKVKLVWIIVDIIGQWNFGPIVFLKGVLFILSP